MLDNFSALLAPISEKEFLEDYLGKKPIHIKAKDKNKFSEIMSWPILNGLLNMRSIWSEQTLVMMHNKQKIPPQDYCDVAFIRNRGQGYQPNPKQVKDFAKKGASIICNDIDQLTPELSAFTEMMEKYFKAKCQSNLYCSWNAVQAFDSHFDTHDVFALHIAGTKTWRIYKGCADNPIPHQMFQTISQEQHNQDKGELDFYAKMEPGDLLYIPRGFYHDAIATNDNADGDTGCIHLSLGVNRMIGLDVFDMIRNQSVQSSFIRSYLPNLQDQEGKEYLKSFAKELSEIIKQDEFLEALSTYQDGYSYNRESYNLPEEVENQSYLVLHNEFQMSTQQGKTILKNGEGQAFPIPEKIVHLVEWVFDQEQFSEKDFLKRASNIVEMQPKKFLQDMQKLKILKAA